MKVFLKVIPIVLFFFSLAGCIPASQLSIADEWNIGEYQIQLLRKENKDHKVNYVYKLLKKSKFDNFWFVKKFIPVQHDSLKVCEIVFADALKSQKFNLCANPANKRLLYIQEIESIEIFRIDSNGVQLKKLAPIQIKEFLKKWNASKSSGLYTSEVKFLIEVTHKYGIKTRSFKATNSLIGDQWQHGAFDIGDASFLESLFK